MKIEKDTLKIIDTHTHLCDQVFDDDREQVLEDASQAGVRTVFSVSESLEDAKKNLALSKDFSMLKPLVGLYPTVLDVERADEIIAFIRQNRVALVGIGEVGLDFWAVKDKAGQALQREIFIRFIQLSKELDLSLNVHSRSAGRHVIELLLQQGAKKVQLHAFDGKISTALAAVEAGYFFSVPPSIVRSRQKQKLVKQLPLSCLLVETDSPVLGAVPGQRNEPKFIIHAIEAIAEIKEVAQEDIIETTFQNTLQLYGEGNAL